MSTKESELNECEKRKNATCKTRGNDDGSEGSNLENDRYCTKEPKSEFTGDEVKLTKPSTNQIIKDDTPFIQQDEPDQVTEFSTSNIIKHDSGRKETEGYSSVTSKINEDSGRKKTKGYSSIIFGVGAVLLAGIVYYYYYSNCHPPDMNQHNYNTVDIFTKRLKEMQNEFPNQNQVIWNMLRNGGKRHLTKVGDNQEKIPPLSYLFAGYAGNNQIVDCFVSKLTQAYTKSSVPTQFLYSQDFSEVDDRGKLLDAITSRLNGTCKVMVVKDIDKLHFNVAQLFMSYADEHNKLTTYPQSVIFFTTELPFSHDPARSRHVDEGNVSEHFQTTVWHGVHPDKAAPLWARVGDGLILIKKEEIYPCNE